MNSVSAGLPPAHAAGATPCAHNSTATPKYEPTAPCPCVGTGLGVCAATRAPSADPSARAATEPMKVLRKAGISEVEVEADQAARQLVRLIQRSDRDIGQIRKRADSVLPGNVVETCLGLEEREHLDARACAEMMLERGRRARRRQHDFRADRHLAVVVSGAHRGLLSRLMLNAGLERPHVAPAERVHDAVDDATRAAEAFYARVLREHAIDGELRFRTEIESRTEADHERTVEVEVHLPCRAVVRIAWIDVRRVPFVRRKILRQRERRAEAHHLVVLV